MKNILNINPTISGEYTVEIIKKNGEIFKPFGDKPLKNLILDTFFDSILRDGYRFGIQAVVQSCKIGGGPGSETQPSRTQTGLQGTQVYISHIGDTFQATVTQSNSSLGLYRDFKFPVNNTSTPVVCREAVVGLFGSSVAGSDITLSRFVFPNDIVINSGEQLRVTYSLNIVLQYIFNNTQIVLGSGDVNLTGVVGVAASNIGIRSSDPSSGTTTFQSNDSTSYYYRSWAVADTATFSSSTTNNSSYGSYTNIFGRASHYNKLGFFDTAHAASIAVYPAIPQTYTALGPLGSFKVLNYTKTDNEASIDIDYYFPPHSSNRTVGGLYLWNNDSVFSYTATYLKFTESNFSTLRSVIIPSGRPIAFRIKYKFSR